MRVAYVCADPGVPVFGRKGCSVHVQEVVRALRREGASVELFATRTDGPPPADLRSVAVHLLPPAPKGDLATRERAMLASGDTLAELLRCRGPFDLVYERYSLWSFAAMEFARDAGVPGLLEVNAPLIEEQARHRGLVDRASAERTTRRAFSAAAALIAVSEETAAYLDALPAARGRVHVIPNGVDPRRFPEDLPPSRPGPPGGFTVGFVGTLKPWHGLDALVEAFLELRSRDDGYRLLIVGDGPERERLAARSASAAAGSTADFTGAVPPEEVPGLLASMDIAVAPYPDLPGFYFSPLKVYEYLAAGRPVVAGRVGQVARIVEHEVNGLLYPPGDAAALAAAIARLRGDAALRVRLGRAGRSRALERHQWRAVARRVLALAGPGAPAAACDGRGGR